MVSVVSGRISIHGDQQQQIMGLEDVRTSGGSDYERSREERIKENRERMQKLGILELSVKLKSLKPTPNRVSRGRGSRRESQSPLPQSGPVRRSSRLQNSTPVSYCEARAEKKEESFNDDGHLREVGSRPEIYTEEHEKLLGSTERSWTLFVDGCGKDGKRIYDPVRGKTCHQCRQKTLGHRTHCSKCNMVQGQFCGDCLYMRYGENVLEANENPNWICPVCRGICNCSLCRQAKGWPPTGTLYRKVSRLGYKSVAHYLIQTRRLNADSDKNVGSTVPVSSKRSRPSTDIDVALGEDNVSEAVDGSANTSPPPEANQENGFSDITPQSGVEHSLDDSRSKANAVSVHTDHLSKVEENGFSGIISGSATGSSLELAITTLSKDEVKHAPKPEHEHIDSEYGNMEKVDVRVHSEPEESRTVPENTTESHNDGTVAASRNCHKGLFASETFVGVNDNEIQKEDMVVEKANVALVRSSKSNKKRMAVQLTPAGIAGRLRSRRNKSNTGDEPGSVDAENNQKRQKMCPQYWHRLKTLH